MDMEKRKTGLYALGLVEDLNASIEKLKTLVDEKYNVEKDEIDRQATTVEYFNGAGFTQFSDGTKVGRSTAKYIRFATPYKTNCGEIIYGWFKKYASDKFKGVEWGTEKNFNSIFQNREKTPFRMGSMYFENFNDGLKFLDIIAKDTIPEKWKYKNKPSKIKHPILKSYLENIFELLKNKNEKTKDKIIYSEDRRYVMFNTNLLDKYSHDVIVYGEVDEKDGKLNIKNPKWEKSELALRQLGFGEKSPTQPTFFEDIKDVIYQTEWKVDNDFDKFNHIIQDRKERFPEKYRKEAPDVLARRLDSAINFAVALAKRNYKFIVPMYRPQLDSIQLLMPIYLEGIYSEHPDFALVLTPDKNAKMYKPETILPLDAAYQNARLIAKPDESWLNPEIIE